MTDSAPCATHDEYLLVITIKQNLVDLVGISAVMLVMVIAD